MASRAAEIFTALLNHRPFPDKAIKPSKREKNQLSTINLRIDAYVDVQEGDLIQVEKGEQVIRGRVETCVNGLALTDHTMAYYSRLGYTVHIIEKAKPKLPQEPREASVIRQPGKLPAYRDGSKWYYVYHSSLPYTWEELLFHGGTKFEVLYEAGGA